MQWSVCLPFHIVKGMKEEFQNASILIDTGYGFGLYSCGDGLIKERGIDICYNPISNGIMRFTMY